MVARQYGVAPRNIQQRNETDKNGHVVQVEHHWAPEVLVTKTSKSGIFGRRKSLTVTGEFQTPILTNYGHPNSPLTGLGIKYNGLNLPVFLSNHLASMSIFLISLFGFRFKNRYMEGAY